MWDKVTLWRGVVIGAELLGLDGFRIVSAQDGGELFPVDGSHDSTERITTASYPSYGHSLW